MLRSLKSVTFSSALLLMCSLFSIGLADDAAVAEKPAKEQGSHKKHEARAKPIFNGTDLTGWDGDSRLWSVKDGIIHGETTKENAANGNTFLIWKGGVLKDFELQLSFRCNATNNSGIQYRSAHLTEGKQAKNDWVLKGYQHEIRNEDTFPNVPGFIYDEKGKRKRISLVGETTVWGADGEKKVDDEKLIDEKEFKALMKIDDWNEVKIIAKGPHIQHYLNGRLIMDCTDNHPELALTEGVLGLQLHAGKPMWAEFKDIRLKQLGE